MRREWQSPPPLPPSPPTHFPTCLWIFITSSYIIVPHIISNLCCIHRHIKSQWISDIPTWLVQIAYSCPNSIMVLVCVAQSVVGTLWFSLWWFCCVHRQPFPIRTGYIITRTRTQTTMSSVCIYIHHRCKTVPWIPNRYGGELIKMHLLCFLCCPSRDILFPILISVDPAYEGDWKVDNQCLEQSMRQIVSYQTLQTETISWCIYMLWLLQEAMINCIIVCHLLC